MSKDAQSSVLCLFPENEIQGLEDFRQKYILHPGKDVPFHITLFHKFILPHDIDENQMSKLSQVAKSTSKFEFKAKPLSSFPTSNVLYLTPSPISPIEELATKLYRTFPDFYNASYGFPVFHMTIALGNPPEETQKIIDEYFKRFGEFPLSLKAGHLGVCAQYGDEWKNHITINIGE